MPRHGRDQHGAEADFERGGEALHQQPPDGNAEAVRHAEIARQCITQEVQELQDHRIVEAESRAHRLALRHARGLAHHYC